VTAPLPRDAPALARLPNWLGEAVMALPAVEALEQHLRAEGSLSLVLPRAFAPLFSAHLPTARLLAPEDDWRGHDTAFLFTNSFRSAWHALRARIPRRVGQARELRGLLLTDCYTPALERGQLPPGRARRRGWPSYLPRPFGADCTELVQALGVPVRSEQPRLAPTSEERTAIDTRLSAEGVDPDEPIVALNVGARADSAKAYPAELWAEVLARLASTEAPRAVLVCGPGEQSSLNAVVAACSGSAPTALVEPVLSLRELVALGARAQLALSADGGAVHVLRAAGAPAVVLCGPSDPRHGARNGAGGAVLRHPVPCGPCHLEQCPLPPAEHHACMRGLAPERVAAACLATLRAVDPERIAAACPPLSG